MDSDNHAKWNIFHSGKIAGNKGGFKGVSALVDFELIGIVHDSNPSPRILRIDWAIDMNKVINVKKHKMIFEEKSLHIVVPLDPSEGSCYIELVCDYHSNNERTTKPSCASHNWTKSKENKQLQQKCR